MKALWVELGKEPVSYNIKDHADRFYKFLYWRNGGEEIVIAGPHEGKGSTHKALFEKAGTSAPTDPPDGAGTSDLSDKTINEWFSVGFRVETPEEVRPLILEVLGMEDDS